MRYKKGLVKTSPFQYKQVTKLSCGFDSLLD